MTNESTTRTKIDYGLEDIEIQDEASDETYSEPREAQKEVTKHLDHTHVEIDLENLNGFWQSQAKRVARSPCTYLWVSMIIAIVLSFIAIVVGEFSVSANTGGWQSRGTLIADRQTQLLAIQLNQEDLFTGDNEYWQELIDNVQPGWEDDDDDAGGRRLLGSTVMDGYPFATEAQSPMGYLKPQADRLGLHAMSRQHEKAPELPFMLTPSLHRSLQEALGPQGCDMDWYNPVNLTESSRLTPMWKTKSESSILDPAVIRDICRAEENTQAHLEEKGLCIPCDTGCLPPYSVVMYARLSVTDGFSLTCDELADAWAPLQAGVESEWSECVSDTKATFDPLDEILPESCPQFFYTTLVGENFDVNGGKSTYTSSIFATPWTDDLYDEIDSYDRGSGTVEGAYDSQFEDFGETYLEDSLPNDMMLAMGSAVVVAIAIVIHTRSPFITSIGLLQIILSFPLSFFVYKLLAGLEFFPFLNFIGIFVVFALGAGDVFVAVDKWKNARLEYPRATTEQVAAVALPDALGAMFLTTLTTAVAFFATAICPVAPIKMFAIFCGLLIMFDYIMNVLLVFPALCIYDRAIQTKGVSGVSCCMTVTCFGYCGKGSETNDEDDDVHIEVQSSAMKEKKMTHQETIDSLEGEESDLSVIRRVLFKFYYLLHYVRWPLFVICWAVLGLSAYFASTLEQPTSSDVRLLTESNEYEQNYLWRQNLLIESLEKQSGSNANVIWGVSPADTGDQNDPGSWTQLVLDPTFDPSSEAAQAFLKAFCEDLFKEDFAIEPESDYICPLTEFSNWLTEQSTVETPENIYTANCNGASSVPVSQVDFDDCIIAWSQEVSNYSILPREGKVATVLFPFMSRVRYDDNYDTQDKEWNLIEDWVKEYNKEAPLGVSNGYFSSDDFWWYDTNGQMLVTAYSAAGIALGCAAAVILLSSRSLMLTLFSTLTIGYVLTSVTAMLVAVGWTLGFLESICFAILIGVSVDYVIHLSHAYASVPGDIDRSRRSKYALIKMGPSILASALTTILSATIMLFTVITFFQKFALILFFTVIQASLGSFIWFLAMVDCIGPSDPTFLADKMTEKCRGKKGGDSSSFHDESERTSPVATVY